MNSPILDIPYTSDRTTTPAYAWAQLVDKVEMGTVSGVNLNVSSSGVIAISDSDSRASTFVLAGTNSGGILELPSGVNHVRWHVVFNATASDSSIRVSGQGAAPIKVPAKKGIFVYNDGQTLQQISGGGGMPQGNIASQFDARTVNVPANRAAWTDSGIVLNGSDALAMNAQGLISHNATNAPYGPDEGPAFLAICVVPDGTTPSGTVTGQIDYRVSDSIFDATGRVWARVADSETQYGDNSGSFGLTMVYFADANSAFPLLRNRRKSTAGGVGPVGPKGDTGATGAVGAPGPQGVQGLKGDMGAQGLQGVKGDTGTAGVKGDAGIAGTNGTPGAKGDIGATGAQGVKGDVGATGAMGAKGDAGASGTPGQGVPTGGAIGQSLRKKSTTDYDSEWVNARLNPRGEWAPNTTYALWDYVFYQNATYIVKTAFTSGAAFDATKWDLLSKAAGASSATVTAPNGYGWFIVPQWGLNGANGVNRPMPAANAVIATKLELSIAVPLTRIRYCTTAESGNIGIGIYDRNLARLTQYSGSGAQGAFPQQNLGTALTLAPGFYWVAVTADNTTSVFQSMEQPSGNAGQIYSGGTGEVVYNAANSSVGGVLPATLGALTARAGDSKFPLIKFF